MSTTSLTRAQVRDRLLEALKCNFLNIKVAIISGLTVVLLLSALAVILAKFEHRNAMIAEQKLQKQREELRIEWTQILLEHSTLASPIRVEDIATHKLNMFVPDPKNIQIIRE